MTPELTPIREIYVDNRKTIEFPVETVEDLIGVGFSESELLDFFEVRIRESLGESVPSRPWLVQPFEAFSVTLRSNQRTYLDELCLDPAIRELAEKSLEAFLEIYREDRLKRPRRFLGKVDPNTVAEFPAKPVSMCAPTGALFIDSKSRITMRPIQATMVLYEQKKTTTNPKVIARGFFEQLKRDYGDSLAMDPDKGWTYFCPYILFIPLVRKGDTEVTRWNMRYAKQIHLEE